MNLFSNCEPKLRAPMCFKFKQPLNLGFDLHYLFKNIKTSVNCEWEFYLSQG